MRKPWCRALTGIVFFALPAFVSVIGLRLDQSSLRHNPAYVSWLPIMTWSSLLLAAVVPAFLIMTRAMPLSRRIGLTIAVWCLLAVECGLAFYVVLMAGLR